MQLQSIQPLPSGLTIVPAHPTTLHGIKAPLRGRSDLSLRCITWQRAKQNKTREQSAVYTTALVCSAPLRFVVFDTSSLPSPHAEVSFPEALAPRCVSVLEDSAAPHSSVLGTQHLGMRDFYEDSMEMVGNSLTAHPIHPLSDPALSSCSFNQSLVTKRLMF